MRHRQRVLFQAKIDYLPKMMNKHLIIMLIIIYCTASDITSRCVSMFVSFLKTLWAMVGGATVVSLVVLIVMVKR